MLQKFLEKPQAPAGEVCEFCGVPVVDGHSHVADLEHRAILCACRGCYLLFTTDGAGGGRLRAIPDRYLRIDSPLTSAQWDSLQIPVGLAFFFYNSAEARPVGFYPSPAGATECLLPLSTWEEVVSARPVLATLQADVEALLVYQREQGFLVPLDVCYELVGIIRIGWRGFHGGEAVHRDIAAFFERVRGKAR